MTGIAVSADENQIAVRFAQERLGSLSERVYAALRGAILAGDLLPDTKLGEADLIAILPVSRTPLREALRRLEAEHLVTSIPNRGVTVHGVSVAEAHELYQVIAELEAMAARLAAPRITSDQLLRIAQCIELLEFYFARERWEEVTAQAVCMHEVIYEACGNQQLVRTLRGLREQVHRFRRFDTRQPERKASSIAVHERILAALSAGDPGAAHAAMYEHIAVRVNAFEALLSHEATSPEGDAGSG